jgi:hypothetical protein
MAEKLFRNLTENLPSRGIFRRVEDLIDAIGGCLDHQIQNPSLSFGPPWLADAPE